MVHDSLIHNSECIRIIPDLCKHVNHVNHFCFCFPGVGAGLLVVICNLIVPVYFSSRLGRANGILTAGGCTGQLLAAPLITYLQQQYAFKGATLLLGAVVFNALWASITFQPVKWHVRKPHNSEATLMLTRTSDQQSAKTVDDNCPASERSVQVSSEAGNERKTERSILTFCLRVIKSTGRDMCILRSPRALIIGISSALMLNGYLNFLMTVPFMMMNAGHSLQDAAWCISVSAVTNLLSRIVMSALTDAAFFNIHICYVTGISLVALGTLGRSLVLFSVL